MAVSQIEDYQRKGLTEKEGLKGIRHLIYPQVSYEHQTHKGVEPASVMNLDQETAEVENVRFGIVNRVWGRNGNNPMPFRTILDVTAEIEKEVFSGVRMCGHPRDGQQHHFPQSTIWSKHMSH